MSQPSGPDKKVSRPAGWQTYLSLGTQLLAMLGLGVFVGLELDRRWNVSPLFILLLPGLALVVSLSRLYRKLTR